MRFKGLGFRIQGFRASCVNWGFRDDLSGTNTGRDTACPEVPYLAKPGLGLLYTRGQSEKICDISK